MVAASSDTQHRRAPQGTSMLSQITGLVCMEVHSIISAGTSQPVSMPMTSPAVTRPGLRLSCVRHHWGSCLTETGLHLQLTQPAFSQNTAQACGTYIPSTGLAKPRQAFITDLLRLNHLQLWQRHSSSHVYLCACMPRHPTTTSAFCWPANIALSAASLKAH